MAIAFFVVIALAMVGGVVFIPMLHDHRVEREKLRIAELDRKLALLAAEEKAADRAIEGDKR